MNLREKIGAILCPRLLGDKSGHDRFDFPDAETFLREYPPGSFLVMGGSAKETPQRLREVASRLPRPPLFAADIEEGLGQQLCGARRIAPMMALGAATQNSGKEKGLEYALRMGRAIAADAAAAGIRWVFAPVLDLARDARNPVIGARSIGADPALVAVLGVAFCEGIAQGGGIATAKHFPGHGSTPLDSHESLPTVDLPWERFEKEDLSPFAAAIRAGVPSIMVGHLAIPSLDPEPGRPASLSRIVLVDLLRKKLGFRGVVVTDALVMGGARGAVPEDELPLRALEAGADVLLMPTRPLAAARRIEEAVRRGELAPSRLEEACDRMERLRREPPAGEGAQDAHLESELARAAITSLGSKPLPGSLQRGETFSLTLCNETKDRDELPGRIRRGLSARDLREGLGGRPLVVVFADNRAWRGRAGLSAENATAIDRALAAGPDPILLAFCSPFVVEPWRDRVPILLGYGATDALIDAALDRIAGERCLA